MSVLQSILTASFCMIVVFVVLAALWLALRLFSELMLRLESRSAGDSTSGPNKN